MLGDNGANEIHQHPATTIYIKLGQFVDFVQTKILAECIDSIEYEYTADSTVDSAVNRKLKSILTFRYCLYFPESARVGPLKTVESPGL